MGAIFKGLEFSTEEMPVKINLIAPPLYVVTTTTLEREEALQRLGDVNAAIKCNIEGRSHNWIKFYSWLEINEETPIEIKLLVLNTCLFMCILHSVEVFGDIGCVDRVSNHFRHQSVDCSRGVERLDVDLRVDS